MQEVDFSASGKTFLDVLKKQVFVKADKFEVQEDGRIKNSYRRNSKTLPFLVILVKIKYGSRGFEKVYLGELCPKSIFVFHSTIKDVVGNLPMDFVEKERLPLANYYAMGHIHQRFETVVGSAPFVYPGPIFPNNFQELVDLKCGSFVMVEMDGSKVKTESILIPTKEVVYLELELDCGLTATEDIIAAIDKLNLRDKIFC